MSRSLLVAIAMVAGSGIGNPVMACSTLHPLTLQQQVDAAANIFRARVVEAAVKPVGTLPEGWASPSPEIAEIVEARIELRELIKGHAPAEGIVRDFPFMPGNCSLGLMPGVEYLFMPDANGFVLIPTGSFGYINAQGTETKATLDEVRTAAKAAPR